MGIYHYVTVFNVTERAELRPLKANILSSCLGLNDLQIVKLVMEMSRLCTSCQLNNGVLREYRGKLR